ncbi:hypothetical protein HanIR_Chr07g0317431 [Helianthus annuus]|nr:hypothetical protein HanIR_Chr07g0317431 [Helianthus annuus]
MIGDMMIYDLVGNERVLPHRTVVPLGECSRASALGEGFPWFGGECIPMW